MAKKEILNNDAVTLRVAEDGVVENVLEAAEGALDVIEDKLDVIEQGAERIITITKNNPYIIAGAVVVGLGVGVFVGYKIAQKRLTAKFQVELEEQVAAAKAHYKRVSKDGSSPEEILRERHPDAELAPVEAVQALTSYQGRGEPIPYNRPEEIPAPEPLEETVLVQVDESVTNVFINAATDPRDWDYRLEVADREANPDKPYVISHEEHTQNEPEYNQVTLTYYMADDTLCDSREQPMDNVDGTVGDDNLQRFGHGSGDANVVYVRNENLEIDYEIVRSMGSYKKDVLGFDDEPSLQHSSDRRARRRRSTDE